MHRDDFFLIASPPYPLSIKDREECGRANGWCLRRARLHTQTRNPRRGCGGGQTSGKNIKRRK